MFCPSIINTKINKSRKQTGEYWACWPPARPIPTTHSGDTILHAIFWLCHVISHTNKDYFPNIHIKMCQSKFLVMRLINLKTLEFTFLKPDLIVIWVAQGVFNLKSKCFSSILWAIGLENTLYWMFYSIWKGGWAQPGWNISAIMATLHFTPLKITILEMLYSLQKHLYLSFLLKSNI